ncbi:hypothetical protein RRG08_025628 [Elysia crispata]|uniref:Uncharacterized protein n=1 Tax=Elysia crispata TaxID=231223 RepID=A0AAE0YEB7_9GAST|nr:hypothetical protein RRG08_025628 [Elysia crispata]
MLVYRSSAVGCQGYMVMYISPAPGCQIFMVVNRSPAVGCQSYMVVFKSSMVYLYFYDFEGFYSYVKKIEVLVFFILNLVTTFYRISCILGHLIDSGTYEEY